MIVEMRTRRELVDAMQQIYNCTDKKCCLCGACLGVVRAALEEPEPAHEIETDVDDPIRTFRGPRSGRQ